MSASHIKDGQHIPRRSSVSVIQERNLSVSDKLEGVAVRNVIDQLSEAEDKTEENGVLFNLIKAAYLNDPNEGVRVSAANHLLKITLRIRRNKNKQNVLDDIMETLTRGMYSAIEQPFSQPFRNFDYINYSMDAMSAVSQSPFDIAERASAMVRGLKHQIPANFVRDMGASYIPMREEDRSKIKLAAEQRRVVVCQP